MAMFSKPIGALALNNRSTLERHDFISETG